MQDDGDLDLAPTSGVTACGMVYNRAFSEKEYRGMLCPWDDVVPFAVTRMNYVYDVPAGAVRGGHALLGGDGGVGPPYKCNISTHTLPLLTAPRIVAQLAAGYLPAFPPHNNNNP